MCARVEDLTESRNLRGLALSGDVDSCLTLVACSHASCLHLTMQEGQPTDPDDRKLWPWWKVKKWVLHIFGRLCR